MLKEALNKYIAGDYEEAEKLCKPFVEKHDREATGLYSMICFILGRLHDAYENACAYRDFYRRENTENAFATFLVWVGSSAIVNWFEHKHGKKLEVFDLEVVYTTEDEAHVVRNKEVDFSESRARFFWECVVFKDKGLWEAYQRDFPKYKDDATMAHCIEHKRKIMSNFNERITNRIKPGERVLDLGSGAGTLSYMLYIKKKLNEVVNVDIDRMSLQISEKHFNNYFPNNLCSFVEMDVLNFGGLYKLGKFDAIVLLDIAEHLYTNEFEGLFATLLDMLTEDGRVYIQTPNATRYLGAVVDPKTGELRSEFTEETCPHVAERTVGYYKKLLHESRCSYNILDRTRITLEVFAPHE